MSDKEEILKLKDAEKSLEDYQYKHLWTEQRVEIAFLNEKKADLEKERDKWMYRYSAIKYNKDRWDEAQGPKERDIILAVIKWSTANHVRREGGYFLKDCSVIAYTDDTIVKAYLNPMYPNEAIPLQPKETPPEYVAKSQAESEIPADVLQWIEDKVTELGSPWGTFNAGIRTGAREMWKKDRWVVQMYANVVRDQHAAIGQQGEEIKAIKTQLLEKDEWIRSHQ